MGKLISIVRSLLFQLRDLQDCNFRILPALLGPVLFFFSLSFSFSLHAEIKLALIDTGFCPEKLQTKVKIEPVIDFTKSVKLDCKKFDKFNPRFHGQLVLEEFLKHFNSKKNKVHIYPLMIFDQSGEQNKEYWQKAIDWVKNNKMDFVLTASGLITEEKIIQELPAIWFVPSGRISPQLKGKSSLFPQNLAPRDNLFLIGDYYDGKMVLYDQGLLYQKQIDYYFPSGRGGFVGTSRAVAEGAARAMNLCSISGLRACLKNHSTEYIDHLSHSKIQTY